MALRKLVLRAGIDRQQSRSAGEGGWWDASRVRWRAGWPEKIGGWRRASQDQIEGRVRALHAWSLLTGDAIAAIGSHLRLYLFRAAALVDITPVDRIEAITDGIATVDGERTVTVTFAAPHGASEGDIFTFDTITGTSRTPSGITVGGLSFSGDYTVAATPGTDVLVFDAGEAATSTDPGGGGAANVTFFLPSGRASPTAGLGYGAGPYGLGGYGEAATVPASDLPARFWSLDSWGELLMAAPSGGAVYSWAPSAGGTIDARAEIVVNGTDPADGPPLIVGGLLVAMPQRQLLLWGCSDLNDNTNFDPMLLRWSDIEDYTMFRASAENAAGSVRLQGGSEIRAGFNTQLQTLIWTDTLLYGLRFIGQPYIYRADVLGRGCGIIGPKAFAEVSGAVYWMGDNAFYVFRGGAPEILPCSVWDDVFPNLNRAMAVKVTAGANSLFGEVLWFYPSGEAEEPDRYVAFNTVDRCWYGGILTRTAWLDRDVMPQPMATCWGSRFLFEHEVGVDADGNPMGEWAETGWMDLDDGEWKTFLDRLLPDWRRLAGTVRLTMRFADTSQGPEWTRGPYEVNPTRMQVKVEARARQIALRIDGDLVAGGNWRLGAMRYDAQPDGKV